MKVLGAFVRNEVHSDNVLSPKGAHQYCFSLESSNCKNIFLFLTSSAKFTVFNKCAPLYDHHRVLPLARISLTLSRHFSLSFITSGRSSGLHPVSSHSCTLYVLPGRPAFARPYVGVHRSTSLMSSLLLLQQCPACLVRLTWIVFVKGGMWPPGIIQYCSHHSCIIAVKLLLQPFC